ncbi:MAG: MFS transporter [Firmicutes bacterium]|nr:MFS transporter [Bacillota bacterium]
MDVNVSNKYRYSLVAAGLMIMVTQFSISVNCFPIFIIPVCNSLGFARGVYSWTQSFISLGSVLASLLSGRLYGRFGIVKVMRVTAVAATVLFFVQSFASSIPAFWFLNLIIGFCNTLSTAMPLALLIGDLFTEKRNTVIGVVMMGSGFGISIFNKLSSTFITAYGWRTAMRLLGAMMAGFSLLNYFALIKDVKALEGEGVTVENPSNTLEKPESFFTPRRTAIALTWAVIAISADALCSTLTPYLQDIGFSQDFAASVYSAGMLTMAAGKILHGMIIDRWGVRVSNTVMLLTAIMGGIGTITFRSVYSAIPVCAGMLFVTSLGVVAAPALAEAIGGQKNKKYFVGKISAFMSVGYMIAPLIYGGVYDRTGSYLPAYYGAIVMLALSLAAVLALLPKKTGSGAL